MRKRMISNEDKEEHRLAVNKVRERRRERERERERERQTERESDRSIIVTTLGTSKPSNHQTHL